MAIQKKPPVIHPFLFALFPVLFLYGHNIGQFSIKVLFMPLAVTASLAFALYLALFFFLKERMKAGLVASLFLVLFFSYGHVCLSYDYIYEVVSWLMLPLLVSGVFVQPNVAILIIWVTIFFGGSYFIIRHLRSPEIISQALNVIAAVLVIMPLVNIGVYELAEAKPWRTRAAREPGYNKGDVSKKGLRLPNIYYLALDSYGNEEALKNFYGYDNSEFLNYLKGKGFYVADDSASNYMQTSLSLASSLNMGYLDMMKDYVDADSNDFEPLKNMIRNSKVLGMLRQHGYRIVVLSSGRPEPYIDNADIYMMPQWMLDEFQDALVNTTPIPVILGLFDLDFQSEAHRNNILYAFDRITDTLKIEGPIFVLFYAEIPHPPFVFNRNGARADTNTAYMDDDGDRLIRKSRLARPEYIARYVDQLIFLNGKLRRAVDDLLSGSGDKPVIILQSDHGARSMLFWENPGKTNMEECMSILNAYYFPDRDYSRLYEGITPVNTFRTVFNEYFSADYELLADRMFFSSQKHPYRFIDVTERAR